MKHTKPVFQSWHEKYSIASRVSNIIVRAAMQREIAERQIKATTREIVAISLFPIVVFVGLMVFDLLAK